MEEIEPLSDIFWDWLLNSTKSLKITYGDDEQRAGDMFRNLLDEMTSLGLTYEASLMYVKLGLVTEIGCFMKAELIIEELIRIGECAEEQCEADDEESSISDDGLARSDNELFSSDDEDEEPKWGGCFVSHPVGHFQRPLPLVVIRDTYPVSDSLNDDSSDDSDDDYAPWSPIRLIMDEEMEVDERDEDYWNQLGEEWAEFIYKTELEAEEDRFYYDYESYQNPDDYPLRRRSSKPKCKARRNSYHQTNRMVLVG